MAENARGMVGVVALQLQLSDVLNIFIRDELLAWLASMPQRPQSQPEPPLRDRVAQNVENIMTRMRNLACLPPAERVRSTCRRTPGRGTALLTTLFAWRARVVACPKSRPWRRRRSRSTSRSCGS